MSLYADDLLLYISDSSTSLSHVFHILNIFEKLSGYKINLQKSVLFPTNEEARKYPYTSLPFKITHQFIYLGIHVTNIF